MKESVFVLENEGVRAVILPEAGGRLIGFRALSHEWLWHNPELLTADCVPLKSASGAREAKTLGEWWNWGGDKSWPAPQGWDTADQWHGPPDPILDAGKYTLSPTTTGCTLTSEVDPRTGVRITREISLSANNVGLSITTTLTNASKETRTWACWSVAQVRTDEPVGFEPFLLIGQRGESDPVVLFEAVGVPRADKLDASTLKMPVEKVVGKLGFPSASGVLEYHRGNGTFLRQVFGVDHSAVYPDQGSRAEIWMQYPTERPIGSLEGLHPSAALVELECLSPLTRLSPGESVKLGVTWSVHHEHGSGKL